MDAVIHDPTLDVTAPYSPSSSPADTSFRLSCENKECIKRSVSSPNESVIVCLVCLK